MKRIIEFIKNQPPARLIALGFAAVILICLAKSCCDEAEDACQDDGAKVTVHTVKLKEIRKKYTCFIG